MKKYIKTDKNELKNQIENKYGINLEEYKNPILIEKVGNLVMFPKYILKDILIYTLLALACFVISVFVLDLSGVSLFIYILMGFLLYAILGTLIGFINFLTRVKNDLGSIVYLSFDLTDKALNDLKSSSETIKKEGAKEIFTGILVVVLIPSITEAVSGQLPLFGSTVNNLVNKALLRVGNQLKFQAVPDDQNQTSEVKDVSGFNGETRKSSVFILNRVIGGIKLPFKIFIGIILFILVLLILIL